MVGRTYSRHRRARDVRRDAERAERAASSRLGTQSAQVGATSSGMDRQ
jgi:hypothetical protein